MSLLRERARATLRRLKLPIPERERTLRVLVPKGTVPAWGVRCLCAIPAVQAWRTAHENGCTKIMVEDGTGHRHEFETTELLAHMVKQAWFLPAPKSINGMTPALMATRGFQALGNTFEIARPVHAVPVAISDSTSV